ncbi:hypothetical protein [Mycobacterium tilburgii]|uniref:hypothetical protein n=1 Tax=Mycobacterium tilburgii TaxID=44467 RepID=UPI0016427149|nr:hypothetical protein [Mycobacterium tilburgii]
MSTADDAGLCSPAAVELKLATTKVGITAGMSMTEKQGGSDVSAGTTQATPNGTAVTV